MEVSQAKSAYLQQILSVKHQDSEQPSLRASRNRIVWEEMSRSRSFALGCPMPTMCTVLVDRSWPVTWLQRFASSSLRRQHSIQVAWRPCSSRKIKRNPLHSQTMVPSLLSRNSTLVDQMSAWAPSRLRSETSLQGKSFMSSRSWTNPQWETRAPRVVKVSAQRRVVYKSP